MKSTGLAVEEYVAEEYKHCLKMDFQTLAGRIRREG